MTSPTPSPRAWFRSSLLGARATGGTCLSLSGAAAFLRGVA